MCGGGLRCGFRGDAFHGTTIAEEDKSSVIEKIESRPVVGSSHVRLCYSQAYRRGKPLTQWPCSDFDTRGFMALWVPGGLASKLLRTD